MYSWLHMLYIRLDGYTEDEVMKIRKDKMKRLMPLYGDELKLSSPWFNREIRACLEFYNHSETQKLVSEIKKNL